MSSSIHHKLYIRTDLLSQIFVSSNKYSGYLWENWILAKFTVTWRFLMNKQSTMLRKADWELERAK